MLPAGAIIIGFRFRPAAAATWLGMPATEVLNQRVALDDIWGAKARRMAEEVRPAREPEALMAALENAVARRAPPAGRRSDMHAAFELLSAGAPPGKSLVPWLGKELALSERTLRRRFDLAFGYGPKTLDRILRFQRFLKLVRGADRMSAAEHRRRDRLCRPGASCPGKPPAGRQHAARNRQSLRVAMAAAPRPLRSRRLFQPALKITLGCERHC